MSLVKVWSKDSSKNFLLFFLEKVICFKTSLSCHYPNKWRVIFSATFHTVNFHKNISKWILKRLHREIETCFWRTISLSSELLIYKYFNAFLGVLNDPHVTAPLSISDLRIDLQRFILQSIAQNCLKNHYLTLLEK